MVATAERSRQPRAPHADDFEKVMESPCPFHPKGKHAAKDCFTLKKYMGEYSKHPAHSQDGSDQNQDQQPGGPAFPNPEHQLNMIFEGSTAYESKRKQKLTAREINAVMSVAPQVSQMVRIAYHFQPIGPPGQHPSPRT